LPDGIFFKPTIPIWEDFVGSCNGRVWYILWPGFFYGHLLFSVDISYFCGHYFFRPGTEFCFLRSGCSTLRPDELLHVIISVKPNCHGSSECISSADQPLKTTSTSHACTYFVVSEFCWSLFPIRLQDWRNANFCSGNGDVSGFALFLEQFAKA
jgi:hypothetical protein